MNKNTLKQLKAHKMEICVMCSPPITGQVNIYVDAVINHMCGASGGEGSHSVCGSWFSANRKDFPSIPFSHLDFNDYKCRTGSGNIENYGDANQVFSG